MYDKEHKEYLRRIRLNKFLVHLVQLLVIVVFVFLWEYLSNNGIIIISATLDKKNKQVLCGPEILTRGFIYVRDSLELVNNVKEMCLNIIHDNTYNNYVDYNKVKNTIRDNLSKYLFMQTGNKPMIITVLQEI